VKLFNSQDFLLFLGTSVFAVNGIGTIIPLQLSMKEPKKFRLVLSLSFMTIYLLLIGFGMIGYFTYGQDVRGPVTLEFPQDDVLVKLVLSLYAVAILLTYPLVFFPAVQILCRLLFKEPETWFSFLLPFPSPSDFAAHESQPTRKSFWAQNLFRTFLIAIACCVAVVGGSNFENFVSLTGGLTLSPLGFIFPPLFHLRLVAKTRKDVIVDITLTILGILLGIFATGFAIYSWVSS